MVTATLIFSILGTGLILFDLFVDTAKAADRQDGERVVFVTFMVLLFACLGVFQALSIQAVNQ